MVVVVITHADHKQPGVRHFHDFIFNEREPLLCIIDHCLHVCVAVFEGKSRCDSVSKTVRKLFTEEH